MVSRVLPRSLRGTPAALGWGAAGRDPRHAAGHGEHWGWEQCRGDFIARKLLLCFSYKIISGSILQVPGGAEKPPPQGGCPGVPGRGRLEEGNTDPVAKGTLSLPPPLAGTPLPSPTRCPTPSGALPLTPAPSGPPPSIRSSPGDEDPSTSSPRDPYSRVQSQEERQKPSAGPRLPSAIASAREGARLRGDPTGSDPSAGGSAKRPLGGCTELAIKK